MADKTKIEWSDATWNPITGCSPVSPGCANCYAAQLAGTRLKHHLSRVGLTKQVNGRPVWTGEVRFNEEWLTLPLRYKKPRRIFVCAHSDIFHSNVPDEWLDRIFAVMCLASQHTFQVLTKRPERMREYVKALSAGERDSEIFNHKFKGCIGGVKAIMSGSVKSGPLRNVWLGVTAENQTQANKRIPLLLETPAAKRFVSIEPMLSRISLQHVMMPDGDGLDTELFNHGTGTGIDWIICGGESGPNARPMHPEWVRSLRDQCQEAKVPFFFKQWGEWIPFPQRPDEIDAARFPGEYLLGEDGSVTQLGNIKIPWRPGLCEVMRVGKKAAGRLVDGKEYLEVPV